MSLFDVLRYPISIPPKDEEIDNLPPKLLQSLITKLNERKTVGPRFLGIYLRIMLRQPINKETAITIIKELRQEIAELP